MFYFTAASDAEVDVTGQRGDQRGGATERPEVVKTEAAPREAGRQMGKKP